MSSFDDVYFEQMRKDFDIMIEARLRDDKEFKKSFYALVKATAPFVGVESVIVDQEFKEYHIVVVDATLTVVWEGRVKSINDGTKGLPAINKSVLLLTGKTLSSRIMNAEYTHGGLEGIVRKL